ncbi:hypothetical protein F4781DRAFT_125443 [Annulohypoxylon bovei var. microspora]|nr:hypothetical protein F4781DRAFT_125443 [Annulohypoxylon bovei var. microspora]
MDNIFGSPCNMGHSSPPALKSGFTTTPEVILTPATPIKRSSNQLALPILPIFPDSPYASSWVSTSTAKADIYQPLRYQNGMSSKLGGDTLTAGTSEGTHSNKDDVASLFLFSEKTACAEKDTDDWEVLSKESLAKNDDAGKKQNPVARTRLSIFDQWNPIHKSGSHGRSEYTANSQGSSQSIPQPSTAKTENSEQPSIHFTPDSEPKAETKTHVPLIAQQRPVQHPQSDFVRVAGHVDIPITEHRELLARIAKFENSTSNITTFTRKHLDYLQIRFDAMKNLQAREVDRLESLASTAASSEEVNALYRELVEVREAQTREAQARLDNKEKVGGLESRLAASESRVDALTLQLENLKQQLLDKANSAGNIKKPSKKKAGNKKKQDRLRAAEERIDYLRDDMDELMEDFDDLRDTYEDIEYFADEFLDRMECCCGGWY